MVLAEGPRAHTTAANLCQHPDEPPPPKKTWTRALGTAVEVSARTCRRGPTHSYCSARFHPPSDVNKTLNPTPGVAASSRQSDISHALFLCSGFHNPHPTFFLFKQKYSKLILKGEGPNLHNSMGAHRPTPCRARKTQVRIKNTEFEEPTSIHTGHKTETRP